MRPEFYSGRRELAGDHCDGVAIRNYSWRPADLIEASVICRVDGGFQRRVFKDVRGLSGGTCRLVQGPWACIRPAIDKRAGRYG